MPMPMSSGGTTSTPLPKLQLFILLYLQVAEPITAFVTFPFINQLIYEYGLTKNPAQVGYYAGVVSSLFFVTEMACVYHWARLSDRIGRRPVLLTGLWGLILSSIFFGVSKTLATLMLSRALSGALNGNIAVIKSMMAEITDETNQAMAFSFIPIVFTGGASAASFMGGGLAHPYERFPKLFGQFQFWKDYPYALPCFASSVFCISAFLLAFFFLDESLKTKKTINAIRNYGTSEMPSDDDVSGDTTPTATTTLLPKATPPPPSLREVLTPKVRIAILNYGTFALINVIFLFVHPLFLSTPIEIGGLGLGAPMIGLILGLNGIVSGIFQILFFSRMHRRFGSRTLFIISILAYLFIYLAWPLMNFLARRAGKIDGGVITVLVMQQIINTFSSMGFSCSHIFITSAAPTRNTLGATTGLGQSLVSLTRAIGPVGAASLFALSVERKLLGGQFVYVVLSVLVFLTFMGALRLPKVIKREIDENQD